MYISIAAWLTALLVSPIYKRLYTLFIIHPPIKCRMPSIITFSNSAQDGILHVSLSETFVRKRLWYTKRHDRSLLLQTTMYH